SYVKLIFLKWNLRASQLSIAILIMYAYFQIRYNAIYRPESGITCCSPITVSQSDISVNLILLNPIVKLMVVVVKRLHLLTSFVTGINVTRPPNRWQNILA